MKKLVRNLFEISKTYPFSIGASVLTLIPWILNSIAYINIKLNPSPQGYSDYRGEGVMFGIILAILLATILAAITLLNLIFQKNNFFYAKLLVITVVINLIWYELFI